LKKNLKISVITVVYNGANTIERTIKSVVNQTYKNIEYIIIDGGSTDGTINIIKKYENKLSYWISEKDDGIYDAMNKGIKVATGDYIGLLNSDDWLELDAIEKIVNIIHNNKNVHIIHANVRYIKENSQKIYKPKLNKSAFLWHGMSYYHPTYYVKKEIYKKLLYDKKYKLVADYKFTLECFNRGYKFYYLDDVITNFSAGGAGTVFWNRIKEGHNIRKEYNYNIVAIYLSTVFRILKTYTGMLKSIIKGNK
jgi:glycosyltransferase involved in cell wall biosynthesis